jgi:hypothetical protein
MVSSGQLAVCDLRKPQVTVKRNRHSYLLSFPDVVFKTRAAGSPSVGGSIRVRLRSAEAHRIGSSLSFEVLSHDRNDVMSERPSMTGTM